MNRRLDPILHKSLTGRVRKIHRDYQRQQEKWLADHPHIRVHCGPGCGYCCNMSVRVNLLEAIMIRNNAGYPQLQPAREAGKRILGFARNFSGSEEEYFFAFRKRLGRCPFLDSRECCTIHPLRPLGCRAVLSGLPGKYCDAEVMESGTPMKLRKRKRHLPAGIFGNSPFVLPLIEMADMQETRLNRLMLEEWGVAVRGELNFLLWLLNNRRFRQITGSGDSRGITHFLAERGFPGFIVETVDNHSSGI